MIFFILGLIASVCCLYLTIDCLVEDFKNNEEFDSGKWLIILSFLTSSVISTLATMCCICAKLILMIGG